MTCRICGSEEPHTPRGHWFEFEGFKVCSECVHIIKAISEWQSPQGQAPPPESETSRGEGETVYTDEKGHILKPSLNELGLAWCRSCKDWRKPVETAPSGRGN